MLFKIAVVLLTLWVPGLFGVYPVGDLFHGLLLLGLMLLVVAVLKARDAVVRQSIGERTK